MIYLVAMNDVGRFQGAARYLSANWPAYASRYGGLFIALILIGSGVWQGLIGITVLGVVLFITSLYFLLTALWFAHQIADRDGMQEHQQLFTMSQANELDMLAIVDLGRRFEAIDLGQHLTNGTLTVVDVYNPQWTTSQVLFRQRAQAPTTSLDHRFVWSDSSINLLPLPDASVTAVFLPHILSELAQEGDRLTLLREVRRILKPHGRVLIAERAQTRRNWLLFTPGVTQLQSADYWHQLLEDSGFEVSRTKNLQDLVVCIRADKPSPYAGRQLSFDLR